MGIDIAGIEGIPEAPGPAGDCGPIPGGRPPGGCGLAGIEGIGGMAGVACACGPTPGGRAGIFGIAGIEGATGAD